MTEGTSKHGLLHFVDIAGHSGLMKLPAEEFGCASVVIDFDAVFSHNHLWEQDHSPGGVGNAFRFIDIDLSGSFIGQNGEDLSSGIP